MQRNKTIRVIRRSLNLRSVIDTSPLPTVGGNDARYFLPAEAVTVTIARADLDTIAAALVAVGNQETLSVLYRLQCKRSMAGQVA